MTLKEQKNLALIGLVFLISLLAYFWFINTSYFVSLKSWGEQNTVTFVSLLVSIKIIGIVWPPLPGGLLTLGSIPILGWKLAYFSDFAGSMIGSSIAFYLGSRYGHKFIHKLFDKKIIDKIHKIKVNKKREVEAIFALRLVSGNTIMEAVCYGAGMLKVSYKNFLIGSVASHTLIGIPTFYFAGNLFNSKNVILNLLVAAIAITIIYKSKGRYFE